jgi:hypothetical protein
VVEGEASQRAPQSLAAGGSSSQSDSNKKYKRFDTMSHRDLVANNRGLSDKLKTAQKRLLRANKTIEKSEARERLALLRGKKKTDQEITLLTSIDRAERMLGKSKEAWDRGTFVNLAQAIVQGKIKPDSIMGQYIANVGQNVKHRRLNSWRWVKDIKRLLSASSKAPSGTLCVATLRGPGGDGTHSTAPKIEDSHLNLFLPSSQAITDFDEIDAVDPNFRTGVSQKTIDYIAISTTGPLKLGMDATHCKRSEAQFSGPNFAAGDVEHPDCLYDWRVWEKQYAELYKTLDGQDQEGKPLGILANPSLITSVTQQQQDVFSASAHSLAQLIDERMNDFHEKIAAIEGSITAKRGQYLTSAANKRRRDGGVRLTLLSHP